MGGGEAKISEFEVVGNFELMILFLPLLHH